MLRGAPSFHRNIFGNGFVPKKKTPSEPMEGRCSKLLKGVGEFRGGVELVEVKLFVIHPDSSGFIKIIFVGASGDVHQCLQVKVFMENSALKMLCSLI